TITIVGTPSVSGTFNYSIPVQGCLSSGVNATGTITVTPNQTVAAASSAPTLCVNSPLAASITHATTNATGIGAPTGLPAGVTASWSANTITIVGTPSVSGTFNYSIPVQGCLSSGVNATGTITVTPNQTVAAASSAPTLCVNSPLATSITHATTNATGIGAPTGLPTGVTASWSANTITILGTPSVSGTFNYSIPVQGCLSSGVNATGTITVNPATSIDSENLVAQSACFGQTSFSPISVTASGTGTLFYQWYSNTNPLNSGGSPIGTDSPTYTPDASTIGTLYYYVVVNSDCGPVATSNISGAFIVDHITAITTQPDTSDRVECFGDGFNPLSVTAVGGDLTYQWYSNSTQTNTGGTAIPGAGATSATFTPPSTTEGISYYYVVVTGNCGTETSTVSGEFRVNPPKTVIDTSPSTSNESKCLGEAFPTLSVLASGEGSVSYQWYKNTTASNSGGTLISGAISEDYTPLSDEIGTFYYYALASSNCGTVPTEVSGSFTVYAPPTVTNPATASICSGASPNISLTASVPSSFSWTIGTITGGITGASAGSGATINQTLTNPSNATAGTVEFIVTPTSTTGSCPGAPYSITVTVNPTPAVTNPATAITCSGTGPNISLTASAPSSFSWTIGTITGGITGASAGSGATINQTLTNPTNTTTGTVQYIVTPTATTGSCPGAPYTITVTVNPLPTVTNSTLSQTICSGGSTTAVTLNSGIAGTSFAWTASATAGVSGFTASGSGPIPIETISTTGTTQGTVTYVITPTVNGCPGPTKNYSVLVNPQPTVTNSTLSQTICSGGSTTAVTPTSGVAGTTFTWTASATAGVSGFTASGSGPIPIQTITTTGTTQGTVTYIITPTANGCPGPTKNYTVLVNPLATVSAPSVAFPSVCISSPALTPFTQTTSGVTAIDRPGVPGVNGLPPGISATFSGNTITFSGTATTTGLYSYSIPLTGTCVTGPATGTIDVTPNYQLSSVSSVSATSAGGTATVTVNADPLLVTNGTYQVQYQIAQGVGSFGPITTSSNFTINNGRGSYGITPINSLTDTYTVQIVSIRKITDACWVDLSASPPTTYFGACSAVFTTNTTFYVPPNIYSVTIQVYGGGGGGENGAGKKGGGGGGYSTRTISVTPGEAIAVYVGAGGSKEVNGGTSYVTRDSNIANQIGNSLLYAEGGISGAGNANGGKTDSRYPGGSNGADGTISTGGNAGGPLGSTIGKGGDSNNSGNKGQIRISYSCPDANKTDCVEYVDDGATTGTTIIRYICDGVWNAPEGLTDFSVLVGGAGGGGGSGNGGGGGGAGSLVTQSYSISNPYGMPAGSNYTITTGIGGVGSTGVNIKGANGSSSSFTGSVNGSSITMTAIGGGGGASASTGNYVGNIGAAGGGGAANSGSKGNGGTPNSAGSTGGLVYAGGAGGNGENNQQTAIAGGGGGGINTDPALAIGQNGKAAGQGQGEGGNGGQGASINFGGTIINYGAGGGGIGALFNGTDKIGIGGIAGGQKLGGDGNLIVTANGGVGYPGVPYSGSGGGAGYNGGGKGGNGVVYISFFNYRILEVSYLYFKAEYNPDNRTGELTWATSQEWENDRFEIERATSNDLTSWTKIGEVTGQGYSDSPTEYKFEDTNLPAAGGNILYRLKQIDVDGSFAYSVTRSIQVKGLKGQSTWVVYPNPSSPGNYVTVDLLDRGSFRDEQIHIKISDVKGVFNSYSVRSVEEVSLVVNDYLEKAAPGVHIVQLIWGPQSEQLKILRR
ncbi:beta strand repeat-containing protein, partial [Algoriphagus winogradskyi]|uniref:beta strand repeat-containing protein n=1 Tax=Algoriphagus winogradskyi TaxID=237017 RepID=UPI00361FFC56